MSSHAANGVAKTLNGRPSLPYQTINPHLALLNTVDQAKLPTVKFQVITRDGQEIIVGRIKIQTPNGHAFILRRYDTGAISQTTMFRAAFPSAPDDLERTESNWVKQNFDSKGANGGPEASGGRSDALRLAGVWVRPEVAKTIAPDYSLDTIIEPLLSAKPDPSQEYRRSTKQNAAAQQANGAAAAAGGVAGIASSSPVKPPSTSIPTSPPGSPRPKRRKEASMAATVATTTGTTTAATPAAPAAASPKKGSTTTETLGFPTPRRSTRTTSPAPVPAPATPATRGTRSKGSKATTAKPIKEQPSARLATPEEEEEEAEAEVPGPNMSEDIAEQKELIAKLKAERSQKDTDAGPSAVPLEKSDSSGSSKRHRQEDEEKRPLKFRFREHGSGEEEDEYAVSRRPIRSNRRISFVDMEPQQKSAAWGALWFAAGLAAAATIPSFFM